MKWTVESCDERVAVLTGGQGERLQVPASWIPEKTSELVVVYAAHLADRTIICIGRDSRSG